jgi:hypothetical protein
MTSPELITGRSLIVFGIAIVGLVLVLRRTVLRMRRRNKDAEAADQDDFEAAEKGAVRATEMLEVRLHDFAREVEGRMLTRIAVLDRLIVDADHEIMRLKELLAATNGEQSPVRVAQGSTAGSASSTAASDAGSPRQPDAVVTLPSATGQDRQAAA